MIPDNVSNQGNATFLRHSAESRQNMPEYHVVPAANQWQVKKKGGSVVSNHRKTAPARKRAKKEAGSGDVIIINRKDGTVKERIG